MDVLNTRFRQVAFSAALVAISSCLAAGGSVKTWRKEQPAVVQSPEVSTKSPRTSASARPLDNPPQQSEPSDSPNTDATYWTNLLGSWSPEHRRWNEARTWRDAQDVLEAEARLAADHGFGTWGLFEFGPHDLRHERSGWDRPIHQFSTLSAVRKRALPGAIATAHSLGLKVHGYIGTLGPDGHDVIPAAIPMYLDELTLMAEAGFDRIYIDASAWNSPLTNAERPLGVGGGSRRDGIQAIRQELQRRGITMEIGVEAWPNDDRVLVREAAPAVITGQYVAAKYRQNALDFSSGEGDTNFHVVIFNMQQDGKDPKSLRRVAEYGYVFDAGGKTPRLLKLVEQLNAIAQDARTRGS